MKTFAERIKALRAEVEALKTVKSKSSTSLTTITKAVTCTAVKHREYNSGFPDGIISTPYMALIEIVPVDSTLPLMFSYSQPPYADRGNRPSLCYGWMTANGNPAVLVDPGRADSDLSIPYGTSITVTMTVYITATADFTVNVSQIQYST